MNLRVFLRDAVDLAREAIRTGLSSNVTRISEDVVAEARARLVVGPRTGRVYHGVRASAPGESPNDPTGALAASLTAVISGDSAEVASSAPYAAYLELGTAKMAPRPFLLPAANAAFGDAEIAIDFEE